MKIVIRKTKAVNEANLILELDMDQVQERFKSKKFLKAFEANPKYKEFGIENTKDLILFLVPEDIEEKYKAIALNWLISRFSDGDPLFSMRIEAGSPLSRSIRGQIELFFQIKAQNLDRLLPVKDINQVNSIDDFVGYVQQAKKGYEEYNKNKISKTQAEAGKKLIYSDDEHNVYIPETKAAACELGKGTEWCTAAPGLDYYNRYHKEDDPLIVFKNKQDPSKDVQMHFGTGQFMDVNDRPIPEGEIIRLASKLKGNKALPESVLKKIENARFEKFEDGGYVVVDFSGTTKYYNEEGQLHRVGGPAYEEADGDKQWWLDGELHRADGPAREWADGTKEWWLDGQDYNNEVDWKQAKQKFGLNESKITIRIRK